MTEREFADLAGEQRARQIFFENCDRYPTTEYFEKLSKHNVDIDFILTGIRA